MTTTPKPRRRWFQFGLRTLLVLMLLFCLVVGGIAVPMHRARKQREAVNAILQGGGWVEPLPNFAPTFQGWKNPPPVPGDRVLLSSPGGGFSPVTPEYVEESRAHAWLRWVLGDDFFAPPPTYVRIRSDLGMEHLDRLPQISSLDFGGNKITDAELKILQGLTHLKSLRLSLTQVSDNDLCCLKGLLQSTGLSLGLSETQVTDAGLEHLKECSQLKQLDLRSTQVTDAGLKHLEGFSQLEHLDLTSTQVTDAGLKHLTGLKYLRCLILSGTQVTGAGLEHLKGCWRLERLNLESTQVADKGLEHINVHTQLAELELSGTQVTLNGVTKLHQALPNCRIVDSINVIDFGYRLDAAGEKDSP